ncbi:MAG TPA: hypothetical protein VNZ52_14225 [Candidatus Thermoplasmatota archaeon]|nr:hypothetical protein [Candidatus Thermoplasmatota archaeon]
MRIAILALVAAVLAAGCLSDENPAANNEVAPAAVDGNGTLAGTAVEADGVAANVTVEHVMAAEALNYAGRTDTGGCVAAQDQWQCQFTGGQNNLHPLPITAMHLVVNVTYTTPPGGSGAVTVMLVPIINGVPEWGLANLTATGPSPITVNWHVADGPDQEYGLGITTAEFTAAGPVTVLREYSHDFTVEGTLYTMPDWA